MNCLYCGHEIGREHSVKTKYCSRECASLYRMIKSGRNMNCEYCGKRLTISQMKRRQRFCSKECVHDYKFSNKIKNCIECGKPLTRKQMWNNMSFCSLKCASSSPVTRKKIEDTNLKKYGVKSVLSNREVRDKVSLTLLRKYGAKKIGECQVAIEKRKRTNLDKYGVDNPFKLNYFQEKARDTIKTKYGVENVMHVDSFVKKIKETNLDKYGVDNICKIKKYADASHKTRMISEYNRLVKRFSEYVSPCFTEEEYNGRNIEYKWMCKKCGSVFSSKIYTTNFKDDKCIPRCWLCYPRMHGESKVELSVFDFVKAVYSGEIRRNVRNVIKPFELDIYLPNAGVAIEINGSYWHGDINGKDELYHQAKTIMCMNKNIQLIQIFDYEWIEKRELVKDRISSIIGKSRENVFARKCVVKEIDCKTCSDFINDNHLQGSVASSIRLGLFYNEEIVSVMTFARSRFSPNKYEYELVRFCSKINTRVIGGAGKLLSYFVKNKKPRSIVSYADLRYSNGKLYNSIGFRLSHISKPNYYWCNVTGERLSRYKSQKHLLKGFLKDKYDGNKSESENMRDNGWFKVYDCGNMVFEMRFNNEEAVESNSKR